MSKYNSEIVELATAVGQNSLRLRAYLRASRIRVSHILRNGNSGKEIGWLLIPKQDSCFDIYYRDENEPRCQEWRRIHLLPMDIRLALAKDPTTNLTNFYNSLREMLERTKFVNRLFEEKTGAL